jgi:hypothetical protein
MIESATTALPRSMWLAGRLSYPSSVGQESLICVHGRIGVRDYVISLLMLAAYFFA